MSKIEDIRVRMNGEWLPEVYRTAVRTQRTRSFDFGSIPARAKVEIMYTLLGIELKVGRTRHASPDLATARYLRVFARLGCRRIAIPYDITQISTLADRLETSWQKSVILARQAAGDKGEAAENRLVSAVSRAMRSEIEAAGAGDAMPQFRQSTSQRG